MGFVVVPCGAISLMCRYEMRCFVNYPSRVRASGPRLALRPVRRDAAVDLKSNCRRRRPLRYGHAARYFGGAVSVPLGRLLPD